MRRLLLTTAAALVGLVAWTAVVVMGALYGWWHRPLAPRGDVRAFFQAAAAKTEAERKGNVVLVLLDRNSVAGSHYTSAGAPVDGDTLFQVASLSKGVTAWGVMALVEEGRLAPLTHRVAVELGTGPTRDPAWTIDEMLSSRGRGSRRT